MKYFMTSESKDDKGIIRARKKLKRCGYDAQAFYLQNDKLMATLAGKIKNGDILEIHGEGIPYVFGRTYANETADYNPFTFAHLLHTQVLKGRDMELAIDLRFCSSGIRAKGKADGRKYDFCFAQDFSAALAHLGYQHIDVFGYPGYLLGKDYLRQSVTTRSYGEQGGMKDSTNCSLENARDIYHAGMLTRTGKLSKYGVPRRALDSTQTSTSDFKKYLKDKIAFFAAPAMQIEEKPEQNPSIEIDFLPLNPASLALASKSLPDQVPLDIMFENLDINQQETPLYEIAGGVGPSHTEYDNILYPDKTLLFSSQIDEQKFELGSDNEGLEIHDLTESSEHKNQNAERVSFS